MVVRIMLYELSEYGFSDIGLIRHNNEDSWAILPLLNFYCLADGMGGHRAGEIASRIAIDTICHLISESLAKYDDLTLEEAHGLMQLAIEYTNNAVYEMGRSSSQLKGMGTTLCTLFFHPKGLIYAHVGDSRIYRLRKNKLEQITRDHSLLRELIDLGQINEQQASDFLYKNIITKAIGTEANIEPSVHISDVNDQDVYLMCTDGLSDLLTLKEMEEKLVQMTSLEKTTHDLIDLAKARGGHDNITVVLIKTKETHASPVSRQ